MGVFIFSCIAFFIGLYWAIKNYLFVKNGTKTTGKVINVIEKPNKEGGVMLYPVYEYHHIKKGKMEFESSIGSSRLFKKIGEKVNVVYNTEGYSNPKIISFVSLYLFPSVILFFGLFFAFFSYKAKEEEILKYLNNPKEIINSFDESNDW